MARRRWLVLFLLVGAVGCGGTGGHVGVDGGGDAGADADSAMTSIAGDASADILADAPLDRADVSASMPDAAADAAGDAPTPCTPCNLQLGALIAGCNEAPNAAGCVVQTSQTTNTDGTTVNVVNQCFAGGTKVLTTKISGGVDGGAFVSSTSQRIKDGATCLTQQTSGVRSAAGLVATDLFLDGAGRIVATVMTNAVAGADGGVTQIQTMTCSGQPSEPYRVCMPPAPVPDAGDAGASGPGACTLGVCP